MWNGDFNPDAPFEQTVAENQMIQQNMMEMQQMQLMQQQQMLQQQQMMQQQSMGMQGYPMQQNYGMQGYPMQQGYGMPTYRYTKSQLIQGLKDYVTMQTQRVVVKEEKLEDTPQLLRHACAESETKISQLGINYFSVPEMGLSIPFYFCTACGKLYYPKDFMF